MPSLWRHLLGRLDRSRNQSWGWKASAVYGMGVWTMLGFVFIKWMTSADKITAAQFGMTAESYKELSEDDVKRLVKDKKLAVQQRQQELAEYVAENIYTPVDFMG